MFWMKTAFRKDIFLLMAAAILLGVILALAGGYLADNYFANMVSGLIGDSGEYDLLFTISSDKEDIAIEQIKNIAADTLPGSSFKTGPKVAGSSNYLLKIPDKYKNEEVYVNLGKYFSDIPGLMSKTIMTEPKLSIRGFRGDTLPVIRPLIAEIKGIDFIYPSSDGLDIIVKKPEFLTEVKKEINSILSNYHILEVRYPLNQHPSNLGQLRGEVVELVEGNLDEVIDVTISNESDRVSLLTSLKQMKTFLMSYATKVLISDLENSEAVLEGSTLLASNEDGEQFVLEVISNTDQQVIALVQEGSINKPISLEVYFQDYGDEVKYLGKGIVDNPRQELADALEQLNEIAPKLEGFLEQSEQLVEFSNMLSEDLAGINDGLGQLENTSQKLSSSLEEWQQEGLSNFLSELLGILDDIKKNTGDITDIQRELVMTSNNLKEGAALIEEKIAYVPRSNGMYQQLDELKDIFLRLSEGLDDNYDLVAMRLADMDPVLSSIGSWEEKIASLLKVEETLNSGANWQEIEGIIADIDQTARIIDASQLQDKLTSIQELLQDLNTNRLPVVLNQLSYIQNSLPDLEESEIVETINLIDSYIAGQVIPGDQIQLLIKGKYNSKGLVNKIEGVVNNPTVTYIEMDAGVLQPNTRGEIFNVLNQVRAVISTIVAFVFTILVMIMDQSLIISTLRLNGSRGYFYGFVSGGLIFSLICLLSGIDFPYLNFSTEFIVGGLSGVLIAFLSKMLNPVDREEWEAGKALGFSTAEIMHEIIIPAGKPGLLYLMNYPRIIFK
ncbi:ABC transporter permease [Halocella sp. SP3-1]|uniref:ABC transporter permease n=1 Tax=Halocella sp. SP3-1 TaxID=2382161 RepID=UPI000F7F67CA|nr:ABC transporter permease [Halocella sp. SP3-1]